ncbi:hypothetical protein C0989_002132 [Termitomyces sp. Mn162]|nr:hypothetical protein C0989_002132 [Termitomyces sp. Mn162]
MGGKFAKRIAAKVALVRNMRAFVEWQRELARKGEPIEEEAVMGGSGVARVKSREVVESNKEEDGNNGSNNNGSDNVPLIQKCPASPALVTGAKQLRMVTGEKSEKDVKMREMTSLATVAEVEQEVSDMEVEGEEEFEAATVAIEEDKQEDKGAEEAKGTWSNMPLCQVGNDELEWLGKDLAWLMPLTLAASLSDFDERAVRVERRFQRELAVAKEELLVARAQFAVAMQTLATLAGYRCNCQAFLAWQEENNIGEGDWAEESLVKMPNDNANLNA